jgi:p-hydroxybenzoate 3-monooxygenase
VSSLINTQVAVIGAGPAGLALANVLRRRGIGCVLLEAETREFIEGRPRAGFIEEWAVRALERHGLAERLLREAQRHTAFEFRFEGARHLVDYGELTGHHHYVFPQTELVKDMLRAYVDEAGGDIRFGVRDVRLHDLESARPFVTYTDPVTGGQQRIDCDFVAGCDGARGVSRAYVTENGGTFAVHDYGIGWLALLAEAPPSAETVVFGVHERGFAAHMARTPQVTRYYLQCAPGDDIGGWTDARVWWELQARLALDGEKLTEGPLIEKRVLGMHNYVVQPMSYGRLHLAGESAHLIAPIGAKGMNLALHDAFLLADAYTSHYALYDASPLGDYSAACLRRVWQYQEFSQWMSDVLHGPSAGPFRAGLAGARLRRLLASRTARTAFAELYIGKNADH